MEARLTLQVQQGFLLAEAQLAATDPTHHLQKPILSHSMAPFLKETNQPLGQNDYFGSLPHGVGVTVGQQFILSRTDSYSSYEFAFPIHRSPGRTTIQEFTKLSSIDKVSHIVLLKTNGLCYCKGAARDHENQWSHYMLRHSEADSLMKWAH